MKKTILYVVLAALCLNFQARAQIKSLSTGLKIGDQVPDVIINNLINYPTKSAKISDFKGRLLILDFWNTWCSACIDEMPSVAKIQQHFDGKIKVISVTTQTINNVNVFLKIHPSISNLKLTMALQNRNLLRLFPNKILPHIVWISPSGKYLGATSQIDLTNQNIDKILASGIADFKEYKNDNLHFDSGKPLFVEGNGGEPIFEYKSFLTKYQPGLPSTIGAKKENGLIRIHATNVTPAILILQALGSNSYLMPANRFIFQSYKDYELIWPTENEYRNKKFYCYEIIRRDSSMKKTKLQMLEDLEHFFDLNIHLEKRKVKCLALSIKKESLLINTKDTVRTDNLFDKTTNSKFLVGQVASFVDYLNRRKGFPPVIDETNYNDNLKIQFDSDFPSIESLNNTLAEYGLVLNEVERNLDMVIISR